MKSIFFILYIFCFASCTSFTQYAHKNFKFSYVVPPKAPLVKKKQGPSKNSLQFKIITKASKDILLKTLTFRQIIQLKKILKKETSVFVKEQIRTLLGKHFYKKTMYKKALYYYSKVQKSDFTKHTILERAKIYHQINKPKATLKLIKFLLKNDSLSQDLLIEVYLLKISILLKQDPINKKELLKVYCKMLIYEDKKYAIYKTKIKHLIFNMKESDILDIKSDDFIKPIKDLIFYRVGKIFFYKENFQKSYFFFKKFLRFSTKHLLEQKALKYLQAIKSRKTVNKKHIGAILPLSGPSAPIGKRSLKGLKMAFEFNTKKMNSFKLIIIDNHGLVDKTQQAVKTLVIKHHVVSIIGGVLTPTAMALAKEAQNFGVPTILMSQKSNLTYKKNYIFQNGLTASAITNQLTEFLINNLNIKRFAILYPNDSYGVDYANAFWTSVTQRGGEIKGIQFYKPGETDFNGSLKRLVGTYYLKDRIEEYKDQLKKWYLKKSHLSKKRLTPPKNILSPIVDFEVLFIPDSLKTLNLIAPHIAYNDIKNIILVGPSIWNQKKFFKTSSQYLDNIIYAEPGLSSKSFKNTNFYKQFNTVFSYKPGLFEVLAYESALIMRQLISSGSDTRSQLREDLADIKTFHGPIGKITISEKREFLRSMQIFKMEDHILSPLSLLNPLQPIKLSLLK